MRVGDRKSSSDGSHAYFGDDNNYDLNPADPQPDESLAQPGMAYDHATETLYIQANKPGDFLYKITGLSGSTWTVQRISGTGALYWSKISRIIWGAADEKNGHQRVTGNQFPFHPKTQVTKGVMADECAELTKSFFRRKR